MMGLFLHITQPLGPCGHVVTDNDDNNDSIQRGEMSYGGGLTIILSLLLTDNPISPIFG